MLFFNPLRLTPERIESPMSNVCAAGCSWLVSELTALLERPFADCPDFF